METRTPVRRSRADQEPGVSDFLRFVSGYLLSDCIKGRVASCQIVRVDNIISIVEEIKVELL